MTPWAQETLTSGESVAGSRFWEVQALGFHADVPLPAARCTRHAHPKMRSGLCRGRAVCGFSKSLSHLSALNRKLKTIPGLRRAPFTGKVQGKSQGLAAHHFFRTIGTCARPTFTSTIIGGFCGWCLPPLSRPCRWTGGLRRFGRVGCMFGQGVDSFGPFFYRNPAFDVTSDP